MRNSYTANSAEALNLHNGSQTAIVVAMKVQPTFRNNQLIIGKWNYGKGVDDKPYWREYIKWHAPYKIGQEVYVRESWIYRHKHDKYYYKADHSEFEPYAHNGWKSPATMPKSAARTRFKIVSCEAVRVKDMNLGHIIDMVKEDAAKTHNPLSKENLIAKFGKSAWDNNHFIWFYKIEKP